MAGMAAHEATRAHGARTLSFWFLALLVAVSIGVLLAPKPAHAATTFTVNRTADTQDANLANAVCDVDPSRRGNQCTLRAAIQEANDTLGADQIRFNIVSAANIKNISPASALPTITEAVTINGYTQTGASANTLAEGNDAVLKVQLNGTNAGSASGLEIRASDSTIKGLVINRFALDGIRIILPEATGNKVQGNFIGTNARGTKALGNSIRGVGISNALDNTVGGTQPAQRNVISGNGLDGVLINASAGNEVQGNFIGTDASGTQDLGNDGDGVNLVSGSNNTIGGTAAGSRNVISGNDENGISMTFSSGTPHRVQGNFIGTDASGTQDLGNTRNGVSIDNSASNNTVGGTDADDGAVDGVVKARNVISGNDDNGVLIFGFEVTGNKVQGNFIGTNARGTKALGNGDNGVDIDGADDNTIGGTAAEARNVISGNQDDGVEIRDGALGNEVEGNRIGTKVNGNEALGNGGAGVHISQTDDNTVGGTVSAARNVISGNESKGVLIFGDRAAGNQVLGNFIGTNASGTEDLGNRSDGVFIFGDASNNTVGSTEAGARNIISGNGFRNSTGVSFGNGVRIEGPGNEVQGNFIGTNAAGTAALGNTADGVDIASGASNNTVGGTEAGARNIISGNDRNGVGVGVGSPNNKVEGNTIRNNVEDGVFISDDATADATGNSILSNRIFANGGLGIDLAPNGVTNNDTDDPDTGANNLQNFPVITGAARSSSLERTAISGTINSRPNQDFTVQCFVAAPDPSNHGEGVTLAGEDTSVQTGAGGDGSFECISSVPRAGEVVSATATNTATGDTSEFSLNRTVVLFP